MTGSTVLQWINDQLGNRIAWNSFFGAGLGAAFYVLLKTHEYLVTRTFDPKYNNAYLTRFVTGMVAGVILSNLLGFWVGNKSSSFLQLSPGVAAIIGGFSAEAVEQILQRMADLLVATVKGDGSAELKAEQTVAQAKQAQEQTQKNSAVREKLAELSIVSGDSAKFGQALDSIRSLLK
jgi:hypothetical protein